LGAPIAKAPSAATGCVHNIPAAKAVAMTSQQMVPSAEFLAMLEAPPAQVLCLKAAKVYAVQRGVQPGEGKQPFGLLCNIPASGPMPTKFMTARRRYG
jgi:hypothetical protein